MRDRFGAAFTGREGEVATFVTHNTMDKSSDNNARQQYNERLLGAKTDFDSLDFSKNATGTAARYVKRYVDQGGKNGKFTEAQQKAIRQRIIDNYSKWSTDLGLPEDMSKLGPKEIELLWRKAAVEEASATRGGLSRARDFIGETAASLANAASEIVTMPLQAAGATIASGSLKQGVTSAARAPLTVVNSGNLPPREAEPNQPVVDKRGRIIISPKSGQEHSLTQGNIPRSISAAAALLREEEQRKNPYPTTYR